MRSLILALTLTAATAGATTHRLAVVIGQNRGAPRHAALRFAEADAARIGTLMTELGGVAPADLKLLQGTTRAAVLEALDWAKRRTTTWHQKPGDQVLVLVYLSSHSDGANGLELGAETLGWKELKAALASTGADVKVAVVDACSASGLLEAGGKVTAPFAIQLDDRLNVSGEALITSSAAQEPSLEAGAFHGSVFTHHLLAGLRGAADANADGQVSLEEAYRYAYDRTVEGESGQHPGYGFTLSGHGELVLTDLTRSATLELPADAEAVVVRNPDGERLLEVHRPPGHRLALPPGRYAVEVQRGGKGFEASVVLSAKEKKSVATLPLTEKPQQLALVRLSTAAPDVALPCAGELTAGPGLQPLLLDLQARLSPPCAAQTLSGRFDRVEGGVRFTGRFGTHTVEHTGPLQSVVQGVVEKLTAASSKQ